MYDFWYVLQITSQAKEQSPINLLLGYTGSRLIADKILLFGEEKKKVGD